MDEDEKMPQYVFNLSSVNLMCVVKKSKID